MRSKLGLILAMTAIVITFVAVGAVGSSQPRFCTLCHEMRADYAAWNSSNHAKATCTACHIGPGVANLMIHKAKSMMHEVPLHFFSAYELPINEKSDVSKEIPARNCLDCHVVPKKKDFKNLIFAHNKHKKLNCSYCHNRTGHPTLKSYKNRATMTFCVNCHKQNGKSTKCLVCHTPSIMQKPPTHKTADWVTTTHETKVDIGCFFCHKKVFCGECHTRVRGDASKKSKTK